MTARSGARLILPPVPHLPGRTPRPPEALFAPLKAPLSPDLGAEVLAASPAFAAGLDAFRARYYWEAHELWEAVWMCLPPAAAERLTMRGLIQLANAGLKHRLGRARAAARILGLADAAFAEARARGAAEAMGITADLRMTLRGQAAGEAAD